jgi:chaperone modulatory protein CbpM
MSKPGPSVEEGVVGGEGTGIGLVEVAQACGTSAAFIEELVLEGVLQPRGDAAGADFGAVDVLRVRRVLRLQQVFDAPLPSVAVIMDLLDEIERLRAQLRHAGLG